MDNTKIEFKNTILLEFGNWCKSKDLEPTNSLFIDYLENRNVITELTIKRFVVVAKYPIVLEEHLGIKRAAVYALEDEFLIPESTIRVYLKRFQQFFKPKKQIVPIL